MSSYVEKRKIVFLTGTRADFGKIKALIDVVNCDEKYEVHIFVTGMHLLAKYGSTVHEILKCEYPNIHCYNNAPTNEGHPDLVLANTIEGFSSYVRDIKPDLIIVHGDRAEALAGAIVGVFNCIKVGHIEGGELSGTLDGIVRHSITKLAHIHFVANHYAKARLLKMGEAKSSIFVLGSPETDLMFPRKLPSLKEAKKYYGVNFNEYALLLYHPVNSETVNLRKNIESIVTAVLESKLNFIVIYPNNDPGSELILKEYERFKGVSRIKMFRSIQFKYFLSFLKFCRVIVGNSSSGVRESPVYGRPSINIGTRQKARHHANSIINVEEAGSELSKIIRNVGSKRIEFKKVKTFGDGKSNRRFLQILDSGKLWSVPIQKEFVDYKNEKSIQNLVGKSPDSQGEIPEPFFPRPKKDRLQGLDPSLVS